MLIVFLGGLYYDRFCGLNWLFVVGFDYWLLLMCWFWLCFGVYLTYVVLDG